VDVEPSDNRRRRSSRCCALHERARAMATLTHDPLLNSPYERVIKATFFTLHRLPTGRLISHASTRLGFVLLRAISTSVRKTRRAAAEFSAKLSPNASHAVHLPRKGRRRRRGRERDRERKIEQIARLVARKFLQQSLSAMPNSRVSGMYKLISCFKKNLAIGSSRSRTSFCLG